MTKPELVVRKWKSRYSGYHYGARYYDPQLGRWHAVDPLDEYYSSFMYVRNNPLRLVDPDGGGEFDVLGPSYTDQFMAKFGTAMAYLSEGADVILNTMSWGNHPKNMKQTAEVVETVVTMSIEHGTPDMISLYLYGDAAFGGGGYHEFAANWLTNGPESGFMPYGTYTGGLTGGWGTAGIGVGLRFGWALRPEVTMESYYGFGTTFDFGIPTGRPYLSTGFDVGLSYSSSDVTWISTSTEFGLCVPYSRAGWYVAETYTVPLSKEY